MIHSCDMGIGLLFQGGGRKAGGRNIVIFGAFGGRKKTAAPFAKPPLI